MQKLIQTLVITVGLLEVHTLAANATTQEFDKKGVQFTTYDNDAAVTVKVMDRDTGQLIKECLLPCHIETGDVFKLNNIFTAPGRLPAALPLTLERDQFFLMQIDVGLPTKEEISGPDAKVKQLFRWAPFMPVKADRSGHCHVKFDVDSSGTPINIKATKCTERTFKKRSLESTKQWRYYPKIIDGQAVGQSDIGAKVNFRLTDADDGEVIPEYPCNHESHAKD